ncbi:MAG: ferredoxin-type protein NapF [Rhodospirillales bacterium]|nr:ferredoxin-type protein NapF [Rhodospirillales bacterium]MCW8862279.1 ferredoxin-type protein NapF [Rhodospirillales bacterium]MCW8952812.1 ferredoxin-type protein NapF [Rhodospirillales bacterium]MCW8970243.1 ferredoxin-type protein NapF [Rhodospirillales bacterium]MCW9002895.1 ferredoxin-type protein NapF [Rhodospirillales bacterium]
MTATVSRFQLLRGEIGGGSKAIRPPHALTEGLFVETCDRSGACVRACPAKIVTKGRGGFPTVDFSNGECTFCMDCVRACRSGALDRRALEDEATAAWTLKATITDACLALRGVTCRTCGEFCDSSAIRFRLVVGGSAIPEINFSACSGCGACIAPCPVAAVKPDYHD